MLLACTDEDLVIMLNEKLFVEHRISYRTFQRYKRRALKSMEIPDADPLYCDLFFILRQAYVNLRQQMLHAIQEDRIGSRRYMWILERKFREWNLRYNPIDDPIEEDDETGPIIEETYRYPTLLGDYCDINNDERPKDIMPVHYAVFNKYVVPNPDYDGDEDDNTREIKRMWDYLQETIAKDAEDDRLREQRILENRRLREEKQKAEAEKETEVPNELLPENDQHAGTDTDEDQQDDTDHWPPKPTEEEWVAAQAQRLRAKIAARGTHRSGY